jgi:hypothetical protein
MTIFRLKAELNTMLGVDTSQLVQADSVLDHVAQAPCSAL